jgi:hypothetical protein
MKIEVRLIPDFARDSEKEIEHEIGVLNDILGHDAAHCREKTDGISGPLVRNYALWTGDFWELYKRIKDRIYRRLEAQK